MAEENALCVPCWRDTPFISGLVCDQCGAPLPGEAEGAAAPLCDDCLRIARPWSRGRAALLYGGKARRMVIGLKYYDRLDLARAASGWMHRAAAPILLPDMVVAPVPLHWSRLLRRRYNQAAVLAEGVARRAALEHCPDLLVRRRRTQTQDGRDREARFHNLADAIAVHRRRVERVAGRPVLLVDDVMTSGATLAVSADACLAAGAREVMVLALARVARDA